VRDIHLRPLRIVHEVALMYLVPLRVVAEVALMYLVPLRVGNCMSLGFYHPK
jgi:hypothetical protein